MVRRAMLVSLAVLMVPAVELLFFRIWLRHGLELRLGLPGFVDYDVILPSVFAFALFAFVLLRERPVELNMSLPNLNLNTLFALAFGALSYSFRSAETSLGADATLALWVTLLIGMIVSALAVLVPFSYVLSHPRKWVALPCLMIASTVVIVNHLYTAAWPWFGVASAESVCSVLQAIDGQTKCSWGSPYYYGIRNGAMRIMFGPPCSGTDGLLLFLVGFTLFLTLQKTTVSRYKAVGIFFVGVAFAFVLNVTRVVAIFQLSTLMNAWFGNPKLGLVLFVEFFHSHAGWLLYAVGWTAFFGTLSQFRESLLLETDVATLKRRGLQGREMI